MSSATWNEKYNTPTAQSDENRAGGLVICGINWGDSDHDKVSDKSTWQNPSFFSDVRCNQFKYRDRLVKWFQLLGHPLSGKEAGPFERSMIQTNWLSGASNNMHDRDPYRECIEGWDEFETRMAGLKPKLIILLSVRMLDALNAKQCKAKALALFGPEESLRVFQAPGVDPETGTRLRRFRAGVQRFRDTNIVALPHPTGNRVAFAYISQLGKDIAPVLAEFKASAGFAQ